MDKIDLILIPSLFGLFLIFFFISYLIKVTLEKNGMEAYSFLGIYWILNISRLKRIIDKNSSIKFLYFLTMTVIVLIVLIILYLITMIIISS